MIEKWVGHGLGIAFRISCKETSVNRIQQQFATPKWVMEAGKNTYQEKYTMVLPAGLKKGDYTLSLKLFSSQTSRTVFLPLNPELKDSEGFYKICTVSISER